MDFITGDIKQLYRKFLTASMASAMVMSIYSFVDTIAVGQSEGPAGAAAMAVINLQSIMHGRMSMMIAVLRSVVISGLLICILPLFMGILGVWVAMPISELIVAVIALIYIQKHS